MIYGDISHLDTLHHAGIHDAKIVLSTIPENPQSALQMYAEGAAYVLMPRMIAAQHLLEMTAQVLRGETGEIEQLKQAHIEQ